MQVRLHNKLVGNLRLMLPEYPTGDFVTVTRTKSPMNIGKAVAMNATVDVDVLKLPLRRFHIGIDQIYIENDPGIVTYTLAREGINRNDPTLKISNDAIQMKTLYSWMAVQVDIDLYEEIFDLDIFEPV